MSSHSCSNAASTSTSTMACINGETPFSAIPAEITDELILTKLDGPTLASAACVSTHLNVLCANENLWMDICNTTWPSITHPSVRDAISTFPSGYRLFFANSFPSLQSDYHHHYAGEDLDLDLNHDHDHDHDHPPAATTHQLISAVDLRYKNKVVFSKVHLINTLTDEFLYWPIDIDVLGMIGDKLVVRFAVEEEEGDELLPQVEAEKLTLSWIVIDPTRKRAANFSSTRPLLVESTNNNHFKRIRYSTLMVVNESSETVEFKISVTFGIECEGQGMEAKRGELVVKEVSLKVVNVDGMMLQGKDGLVNLQKAMAIGRDSKSWRKKRGNDEKYEEYLKMTEERKAKKAKEMALNFGHNMCMFLFAVVVTGWWICFCFFNYILVKKKKIADCVSKYWR